MATRKKTAAKKSTRKGGGRSVKTEKLNAKALAAAKRAADLLWDNGVPPHRLLQEVHEILLLRCLEAAKGNYAAAAELFGPSRQSVQQYANSPLRDLRWRPYQQNKRKTRDQEE